MTYTEVKDTIIRVTRNRVRMYNMYVKEDDVDPEIAACLRNEITGLLICLKNINPSNETWCTHNSEDSIEIGYYDEIGQWISVAK